MQRKPLKPLDVVLRSSHYKSSSLLNKHERMLRPRSNMKRRQDESRS